jgi:TPR repeat protein
MDTAKLQRLIRLTEPLVEKADWPAIEALWLPYSAAGDVESQFRLAYYYLFSGFDHGYAQREEMEDLLRSAAAKKHASAVYWLSHLSPDDQERDALLLQAGELGSLEAQRELGACYATGKWTGPRDAARAAEWYLLAAQRGEPEAQYHIGFLYLQGEGIATDVDEGLRWLRSSAAQGNGAARRLLAEMQDLGL